MCKPTIFLDIDGVLCTIRQYSLTHNSKSWLKDYGCYPFDQKCVKVLNEILDRSDAQIVLSSDWRIEYSLEELDNIFKINGVKKSPIDITPDFFTNAMFLGDDRATEIMTYVAEHEIENWIAIDDLNMFDWLGDNFFYCKSEWEGIKQSGLKQKIIKRLL